MIIDIAITSFAHWNHNIAHWYKHVLKYRVWTQYALSSTWQHNYLDILHAKNKSFNIAKLIFIKYTTNHSLRHQNHHLPQHCHCTSHTHSPTSHKLTKNIHRTMNFVPNWMLCLWYGNPNIYTNPIHHPIFYFAFIFPFLTLILKIYHKNISGPIQETHTLEYIYIYTN